MEIAKMIFSNTKSQLISSNNKCRNMILQGKEIKPAPDWTYKYLGTPISKDGIKIKDYLTKNRRKYYAQMLIMNKFIKEKGLSTQQGIILYKSIVRSQWEYGMQNNSI